MQHLSQIKPYKHSLRHLVTKYHLIERMLKFMVFGSKIGYDHVLPTRGSLCVVFTIFTLIYEEKGNRKKEAHFSDLVIQNLKNFDAWFKIRLNAGLKIKCFHEEA